MHPLVKGAAAVAVLTALGSLDQGAPPPPPPPLAAPPSERGVDGLPALCDREALPEGPVCVRIPPPSAPPKEPLARRGSAAESIPRRPDRSPDPASYRYPVEGQRVLGGFDVSETPQGVRLS